MPLLPPPIRLAALLLGATVSSYMAGVIWTVQLVHYRLFDQVGADGWLSYHAQHTRRMTWVVLVPMMLELGTASVLVWEPPQGLSRPLLWIGFALALLTWVTTFLVSVPLHGELSRGWDAGAGRRLVGTNWVRTALWSGHALVMCFALWRLLRASLPS